MKTIKSKVKTGSTLLYCPYCKCKPVLNYKLDADSNLYKVHITCPACYSFMVNVQSMSKADAINRARNHWRRWCLGDGSFQIGKE